MIKILLKAKKVIFWLFNLVFKLFSWLLIYKPSVWLYKGYLKFKRRLINHYQQNLWLTAAVLMGIAVVIAFNNWQESGRLVAVEDLVRGTWLSRLVGDEFNQLNDIVVDSQPNQQLNLNHPDSVANKLSTLGAVAPSTVGLVGMTTDRWVYGLGMVSLPSTNNQPAAGATAGSRTIAYYTVKIGDTLSGIAKSYGVSVNTIAWQSFCQSAVCCIKLRRAIICLRLLSFIKLTRPRSLLITICQAIE